MRARSKLSGSPSVTLREPAKLIKKFTDHLHTSLRSQNSVRAAKFAAIFKGSKWMSEILTITAENFVQRARNEQLDILDVRTPLEFQEVHALGSQNRPLDRLRPDELVAQHKDHPETPVYLMCRTGGRATKAAQQLNNTGMQNAIVVTGGIEACVDAGLPVKRGRKVMSLERQVRIAAGSLVLLGVVLAAVVHPWCVLISAFVGAGLVFAGLTDTCGMGLLLAKMPWNQRTLKPSVQPPSTKDATV